MKKRTLGFLIVAIAVLSVVNFKISAQVGIGTVTPRGALDIVSSTQGVIIPTVSLADMLTETAVNPQGGSIPPGTIVYNDVTSGASPNTVGPGLYFWNGARWVAFAGSPGGLDWSLKGNSGTNNGTDFLGTTDNQPLVIKVNNTERIRMGTNETVINEDSKNYDFRVEGNGEAELFFVDAANDHVHVRAASPFPEVDMFTVVASDDDYPMNAYATGQGNAAVYGRHSTLAAGDETNVAGAFDGGNYGYPIIEGYTMGASIGGNEAGAVISSNAESGDRWGLISRNSRIDGDGDIVIAAEARLAGYSEVVDADGYYDYSYYGGYFDGGRTSGDYSYIGLNWYGSDYKIIGGGSVSTIVTDTEERKRIMFAPEAPEILFEDYGGGKLVNGKAYIEIDPIFAKNIVVNEEHPLRVFIQLEGNCNGVFTTEKTDDGFWVKELSNGTSNTSFSWHIVAVRKNTTDENGNITSKHEGVRFPYGPGKLKPLKYGKAKIGQK